MRPRKKSIIKGPVFPSFINQRTGSHLVMVWKPGTQSQRQRIRYLTRQCRAILDSRDADVQQAGALIFKTCEQEAAPKLASLILINAALEASNDTGEPWSVCANIIVSSFIAARVARLNVPVEQPVTLSPPAERI